MNKLNSLATTITLPLMALATIGSFERLEAANTVTVVCDSTTAIPTVTATFSTAEPSTPKSYKASQTTEILSFLPEYFAPDTALQECQKTANSLQKYYSNHKMNYLASDTIEGQPVVCAVERRGVSCDSYNSEILFALKQKVNPTQMLYDMLGGNFKDAQVPASRTVSRIYTDLRPSWWPF